MDRVKAIHLIGPGGLQWWIEGEDSIADVDALLARHPCLDRTRIITGTIPSGRRGTKMRKLGTA